MIDGLPPYEENVLSYTMEERQAEAYGDLQERLKEAVKAYKTKALGSMLQALLSYPDSCVQFPEHIVIRDRGADEELETIEAPIIQLAPGELLPKEKDFVDIVKKERKEGRKVLCYLTFTNSRDIRPRLKKVLEEEKIRVGVLESSVSPEAQGGMGPEALIRVRRPPHQCGTRENGSRPLRLSDHLLLSNRLQRLLIEAGGAKVLAHRPDGPCPGLLCSLPQAPCRK